MRNIGNTCYASSVVWALKGLKHSTLENFIKNDRNSVSGPLKNLIEDEKNNEAWVRFVKASGKLIDRKTNEPHDAHELLCAIIDHTKSDKHFSVSLVTMIKCLKCNKIDTKVESNTYITSPPIGESIVEGIKEIHKPETVSSRVCDHCKSTCDATIRVLPKTPAPPVLVVRSPAESTWVDHRFGYCGSKYFIRSVILYVGNGRGGHYKCMCFDGSEWKMHDDDSVFDISPTMENNKTLVNNPHTLLYEKQ